MAEELLFKVCYVSHIKPKFTISNTLQTLLIDEVKLPTNPFGSNVTIKKVHARLRCKDIYISATGEQKLNVANKIQVKEKVSGTWTDAIDIGLNALVVVGPDNSVPGFDFLANPAGLASMIDISGEVDTWDKTYQFQWLNVQWDTVVNVDFHDMICELEIWLSASQDVVQELLDAFVIESGAIVADGSNTGSTFKTNLPSSITNHYRHLGLLITSGTYAGQIREVIGFDQATDFITVAPGFTSYPGDSVTFTLITPFLHYADIVSDVGDLFDEVEYGYLALRVEDAIVVDDVANTDTTFKTNLSNTNDDFYNNLQLLFMSGSNASQSRRIIDYDGTTKFVTLSDAFHIEPTASDEFTIVPRYTGAGSGLTEASIADAVWSEDLPGSYTGDDAGKQLGDVHDKLPTKTKLRGTADDDGGMDTEDKADINAEADQALVDYDPPTRLEATADKDEIIAEIGASETTIIAEINANETLIITLTGNLATHDSDIKTLLGTPIIDIITDINNRFDTVDTNIQANYDAIILIQNNVSTVLTGPKKLVRPDSGTKPYRYFVFNYDNTGNMEDFNVDPTLTGTYISGGGPYFGGTMTRDGVGQYHFDIAVAFDDTLGAIQVKLDAVIAGTLAPRVMVITSEVTDYDDELQEIYDLAHANYVKLDAATPSPTIPAQLTTMETNLTAEIDENQTIVETIRDDMEAEITYPNPAFIGSGYSRIESENPIPIGSSTIPLIAETGETFNQDGGSVKLSKGEVEVESIDYTGIVDDVMTLSTPTANEHQPNASVYEVTKLNFHMTIRRKDGDVNIQADSLPSYSIASVIVGLGGLPEGSGSMTWEAVPARYVATVDYDIDTESSQRVCMIDVTVDGKTRDFSFDFELMERPATERQINEAVGSAIPPNTIVFDHDGWIDEFGIKHLWDDLMEGAIKDDAGQPLILNIKAYLYDPDDINTPILGPNPRYDNWSNQFGHYVGGLPAGKYLFVFIANGKKWKQVDRYIDYP